METSSADLPLLAVDATEEIAVLGPSTWRRRDLARTVAKLDEVLLARGAGPGSRVGVVMRNSPAIVAAIACLLTTRRTLVVINPNLPGIDPLREAVSLGTAATLVTEADSARPELISAFRELNQLLIEISDDPTTAPRVIHEGRAGTHTHDETAILMLTSGTTGPPKRIPISRRALLSALSSAQKHYVGGLSAKGHRRGQGVSVVAVPCVNISGLWAIVTALVGGGQLTLLPKFEPAAWSAAVAQHKPRTANIPPAAVRMLLDSDTPADSLSSLRAIWAGTAPLDPALVRAFSDRYGIPVLTSYGATEFTGGVAGWSLPMWREWGERKVGSVGRPHPGVEVKTVDAETGADTKPDEVGIIAIRTAQANVAKPDEWVRTNDIGRVDRDGFVWIVGRADDTINRGGFKIQPADVERAIRMYPHVTDVAVIGVPDERLGQVPVAIVVSPEFPGQETLRIWLRKHLAAYAVPTRIIQVDEIPRNEALKPVRPALMALVDMHTRGWCGSGLIRPDTATDANAAITALGGPPPRGKE